MRSARDLVVALVSYLYGHSR